MADPLASPERSWSFDDHVKFESLSSPRVLGKPGYKTLSSPQTLTFDKPKYLTPKRMGKYTVIKKLGSGAYGSVYLAELEEERYAIKEFFIPNPEMLSSLIEIDLEMRLRHPHIVKGIEVFRDPKHLYFVQQLADNSLSGYLRDNQLSIQTKIRLIYELGTALHYLLSIGVIHCDIKPDNVLILNDRILLADMGIAAYIDAKIEVCETMSHRAPEFLLEEYLFQSPKYDYYRKLARKNSYESKRTYSQGEIWSYGMVALDILYNKESVAWSRGFLKFISDFAKAGTPRSAEKFILDRLGPLPEDHIPMLNMILTKMLTYRLNRRCNTFIEVLSSDVFTEHGFSMGMNIGDIRKAIDSDDVIKESERKFFVILNNWIIEVLRDMRVVNRIAFLVLALVRGLWNKYVDIEDRMKIQLFGCACIYLGEMVITGGTDIYYLSSVSNDLFTEREIFDYAMKMFIEEKGVVSRSTLYDYLSSLEMLQKAIVKIYDPHEKYEWSVLTTKQISDSILSEETALEADHRTLKDSVTFDRLILVVDEDGEGEELSPQLMMIEETKEKVPITQQALDELKRLNVDSFIEGDYTIPVWH